LVDLLDLSQVQLRNLIGMPTAPADNTVLQYDTATGVWLETTLVGLGLVHTDISDFDTGVQENRIDQMAQPTADVNFNGQNLTNVNIGHDDFTAHVHADVVHVQVRNESGGVITRGDAVHVSGYSIGQDLPLVVLADSSSLTTMPAFGVVSSATIANNANCSVYISGRLENVDTSAWSAGDVLYVSTTGTTTNTLTNVKPSGTE
jgi:hypothetical protein